MAQGQQRQNLVLIHLESISNTILWQYRAELATVWRLMQQSMFYSRFQAASTSSAMCTASLTMGNMTASDFKPRYEDKRDFPYTTAEKKIGNLFADIRSLGYQSKYFFLDHFTTRGIIETETNWILSNNTIALHNAMQQYLTKWRDSQSNFFLYFQNDISHMAFDDEVKIQAKSFTDRFRLAYMQLDASINSLLQQLAALGFWENTIIVCYGDHGDELWGHALTKGFCHAIAPYASLTWTPLFVYDNGNNIGIDDRLISMIDVRETVIKRIAPDYKPPKQFYEFRDIPFSGINFGKEKREFAFSQNLYALQLEYADRERALTKGYSVTDGIYRLMTVSGGKRPKEGGLGFYYDRLDPTNNRNLLDFFKLGVDGDIIGFYPPPEAACGEFNLVFTPETVRHMIESYRILRRELYDYVRAKETEALKYNQTEYHIMPETAFRHSKRRIAKDYDE